MYAVVEMADDNEWLHNGWQSYANHLGHFYRPFHQKLVAVVW